MSSCSYSQPIVGSQVSIVQMSSSSHTGIGSRRCVSENAANTQYVKLLTLGDKLSRCGASVPRAYSCCHSLRASGCSPARRSPSSTSARSWRCRDCWCGSTPGSHSHGASDLLHRCGDNRGQLWGHLACGTLCAPMTQSTYILSSIDQCAIEVRRTGRNQKLRNCRYLTIGQIARSFGKFVPVRAFV